MAGMFVGNKKIKLAICGLGRFANKRIIPALEKCSNIELSAIVSRSSKEGVPFSSIPRYSDLNELTSAKTVDAVYIASPNNLHVEQTIFCLKAGLPVLCEKPMATNYKDCQLMLDVAKKMNLHLVVGHMLRFSPALKLARNWVQGGLVGEVFKFDAVFHYNLPVKSRSWANDRKLSGGGVLLDAGIHCLDVIQFFLGKSIEARTAQLDQNYHKGGVENQALLEFGCGSVQGSIDLHSKNEYRTFLEITGAQGVVTIENFAATWASVIIRLYNNKKTKVLKEIAVDVSEIYRDQLQDFATTILLNSANTLDYSAAENVLLAETFYSLSSYK